MWEQNTGVVRCSSVPHAAMHCDGFWLVVPRFSHLKRLLGTILVHQEVVGKVLMSFRGLWQDKKGIQEQGLHRPQCSLKLHVQNEARMP